MLMTPDMNAVFSASCWLPLSFLYAGPALPLVAVAANPLVSSGCRGS